MAKKCLNCDGTNDTKGSFCGVDCWWLYRLIYGTTINDDYEYKPEFEAFLRERQ